MKKNINLETVSNPLSILPLLMNAVIVQLEKEINDCLRKGNFGGDSIDEQFTTVIRVFERERFELHPEYYKPIAKKGRKTKAALITQDINLEELEGKDDIYIYNRFIDCVIASVRKLLEINVMDVKTNELIYALDRLRK